MESREPGFVGELDEIEPILEQLMRRRAWNALDVVEDAEGRCRHGDPSSQFVSRFVWVLSIVSHEGRVLENRAEARLSP